MMYKEHYVYVYSDPRKEYCVEHLGIKLNYQPFYVGKGTGSRHLDHLKPDNTNKIKHGIIKQIFEENMLPEIIQVKFFDTDLDAKNFEIELIADIGTRAIVQGVVKRGPLSNLTKGGDGGAGWSYVMKNSSGYKERLSHRVKEYMNRPEVKQKLRDGKLGDKNPQFGKKHAEEQLQKIRESTSKSKKDAICITDGVKNKYVHLDKLDEFLSVGWKLGMTKGDREKAISKSVTGRIHINDGTKSKMILKEELPAFIALGWELGRFGIKRLKK